MKVIMKITAVILCLFVMFSAERISVRAEEDVSLDSYSDYISEKLDSAIDSDTSDLMREHGAEEGLDGVDPEGIITLFLEELKGSLTEPIVVLGRLAAVLILSALMASFAGESCPRGFAVISVLACITMIYRSVYGAFVLVSGYLDRLSEFMLAYIPIYASVTAASGRFTAGGSYYASALSVCELIAFVSRSVIMPFLSVFMALSFTAAIDPDLHFSNAAESVKNAVRLILTALMTLYTGLMSVKSIAGAAADNAASRAVKFGASSFIPIIGGSVSEAYSSVYAGIGVIRSAVGSAGIAAVIFMAVSPIAALLTVKVMLEAARVISELLGLTAQSELLRSTSYAVSAAVSTVLCFSMMFIISTAVLMMAAGSGAG